MAVAAMTRGYNIAFAAEVSIATRAAGFWSACRRVKKPAQWPDACGSRLAESLVQAELATNSRLSIRDELVIVLRVCSLSGAEA